MAGRTVVALAITFLCAAVVALSTSHRPSGLLEACGESCLQDQIAKMYKSPAADPMERRYLPSRVSAERWPVGVAPAGEEAATWPTPGGQLSPSGEVSAPGGPAGAGGDGDAAAKGGGSPQAVLDVATVDPELLVAAELAGEEAARRALPLAKYERGPGEYDALKDPLFQDIDAMGRGPSLDGIIDAPEEEPEEKAPEEDKGEEEKEQEVQEEQKEEEAKDEEEAEKDDEEEKAEEPSPPSAPGPPAFSRSSSAGFDFHFFPKNKPPARDPAEDNPFAFGVKDEPIVATSAPEHLEPFSNGPMGEQHFSASGDAVPDSPIVDTA